MSVKAALLRLTDTVVGPLVCRMLSRTQSAPEFRTPYDFSSPILLIRPGGIGDALVLLPALQALQAELPEHRIDILCESRNQAVFELALPNARIYTYDKAPFKTLSALCSQTYGTVIDTEQFHSFSGVMTALTKAPLRIGFKINTHRHGLYTHLVSYDLDGPEDLQFGRLIESAFGKKIQLPSRFRTLAQTSLPDLPESLAITKPYLLLHAGASIPSKKCVTHTLAQACKQIHAEFKLRIVITGGSSDCEQAAELTQSIGNDCINICGQLTLAQTATLCKNATLLLGPDSGIAHLAVAVGTPAAVCFGPSDPAKWGPPEGAGISIRVPLPCSPCSIFGYTKPCNNYACMHGITETTILDAIRQLLTKGIPT